MFHRGLLISTNRRMERAIQKHAQEKAEESRRHVLAMEAAETGRTDTAKKNERRV